ncbi:MAG: hypothetical protein R3B13_33570 [Polyangiaceae bacterium]
MRAGLLLIAVVSSGCGYGLMQTAHTEPPNEVGAVFGAAYLKNELSGVAGRNTRAAVGMHAAPRLGLSDHIDIGLQPWLLLGARADVKVDLLAPLNPLAIAPRFGVGYARGIGSDTAMVLAGGIASYRVTREFEPYAALTFANHWITRPAPEVDLAPDETLAPRSGVGDGLLQLHTGFELRARTGVGVFLEYGLWLPARDDPGDSYAFVTTHIFAIGIHAFSPRRGEFPRNR